MRPVRADRWLAGQAAPPARVTARSAVFLEVSEPSGADPLPAVWGERARLQVTDRPAAFLAAEFYDRLATGATVGRAMTKARLTTRRRWPDDPTWLANSVYAHPNTTVAFRLDVA